MVVSLLMVQMANQIAEWEPISTMVVPDGDPVDGWPIVIDSHGTGGIIRPMPTQ